jgi:hypothetical protein
MNNNRVMPITGFTIKATAITILFTLLAASGIASAATTDDLLAAKQEAEARKAIAEAERAELLARLPPSTSKPLAGAIDTRQFGAAGLARAFDLAHGLAGELCAALPAEPKTAVYEAPAVQGILAARLVADALARYNEDLGRQNKELQLVIEAHTPQGTQAGALPLAALAAIPATVKAAADLSALFKSDVGAEGIAYGEGARGLFVSALAQRCPDKVAGLGSGYLGELDGRQYDALLAKVRTLAVQRGEFANRLAILQKLLDGAKGDEKKDLAAVAASGGALLKTVDGFVDSLKAGEASDNLRLEGMTIVKDSLFTGQRLRLSGVAFLWYRVYEPNGTLRLANAVRRMAKPVEVDLRGESAGKAFWD